MSLARRLLRRGQGGDLPPYTSKLFRLLDQPPDPGSVQCLLCMSSVKHAYALTPLIGAFSTHEDMDSNVHILISNLKSPDYSRKRTNATGVVFQCRS